MLDSAKVIYDGPFSKITSSGEGLLIKNSKIKTIEVRLIPYLQRLSSPLIPRMLKMSGQGMAIERLQRPEGGLDFWRRFVEEYAELQIQTVEDRRELLRLNVRTPLDPSSLKELHVWTQLIHPAAAKKFEQDVSQLGAWPVPFAFEHGDLHMDNVLARRDGSPALIDYSEVSWSQPFLSMAFLFSDKRFPYDPEPLKRAYLLRWSKVVRGTDLNRCLDFWERFSRLLVAFKYNQDAVNAPNQIKRQFEIISCDLLARYIND